MNCKYTYNKQYIQLFVAYYNNTLLYSLCHGFVLKLYKNKRRVETRKVDETDYTSNVIYSTQCQQVDCVLSNIFN